MKKKTTYIYALADPRGLEVRYIGKSDNPRRRLIRHLNDKIDSYKRRWLNNLFLRKPILMILEKVSYDDWESAERKWIAHYKSIGCRLTNGTSGGEGGNDPSEEARAKMRKARLGYKASKSACEKMKGNQNAKGYRHTKEALEKISKASHERIRSAETRKRMSIAQRGGEGHNAKLTIEQVHEIRRLSADGLSQRKIAYMFDMSSSAIARIQHRLSWKDV